MRFKQRLVATVIDGDEAALRTMAFLGFAPLSIDGTVGLPACSAVGRRSFVRAVLADPDFHRPIGTGMSVAFSYVPEGAHVLR